MRSLALIVITACSAPFQPAVVYIVAPQVSERMAGDRCESAFAEPALDCAGQDSPRYDGCHWRCAPWFDVVERQSECGPIVVNGYQVEQCKESAPRDRCSPFAMDRPADCPDLTQTAQPDSWRYQGTTLQLLREER